MDYHKGQHVYILEYVSDGGIIIDSKIEELEILGVANTKSWRTFYTTKSSSGSITQTMNEYIYSTKADAEHAKAYLTAKKKFFMNLQAPYGKARLLGCVTSAIWLVIWGIIVAFLYNLGSIYSLPTLFQIVIAGLMLLVLGSVLSEIDAFWNCMAVPSYGPRWLRSNNRISSSLRKKWRKRLGIQLNKEDLVRLEFR